MVLADRMSRLGTETAFQELAKAQALEARGKDIIHLEIGEPDFDTPSHIRTAAKEALDKGATHYCNSKGILALRQEVALTHNKSYRKWYRCVKISVTEGGEGDTTQHTGIRPGTTEPIFRGNKGREGQAVG